ncbi:unnamed protein product [marine sediment metagenome]|uniref:Uncharacterized protein n=1 Tax=marine sediment metagenome TaxID=412755 RepID=X0UE31_9ZZZZ
MGKSIVEGSGRLGEVTVPQPAGTTAPAAEGAQQSENSVEVSMKPDVGDNTVSIRRIENGFITQQERYVPGEFGGKFEKKETFTPEEPDIEVK